MDIPTDIPASPRTDESHAYGISTGTVATATGALVAERLEGTTRTAVWTTVTTLLAVVAVLLAKPGLAILSRFFRINRDR
jgi:hypothetical protein